MRNKPIGEVPVCILVMLFYIDDEQHEPPTTRCEAFDDEQEAKEFLYDICSSHLSLDNYETDDEADNDNEQDNITQEAKKRKILREIIFDEEYEEGDPEYDNIFKGQYIKYVMNYDIRCYGFEVHPEHLITPDN